MLVGSSLQLCCKSIIVPIVFFWISTSAVSARLPRDDVSAQSPKGPIAAVRLAQASQNTDSDAGTSTSMQPVPAIFDLTAQAVWDGGRTLRGVWVAHPLAKSARRVRIYNLQNGRAVDGALFSRDPVVSEAPVLISSEAAQRLEMVVGEPVELRIVAIRPAPAGLQAATSEPARAETATAQPVDGSPADLAAKSEEIAPVPPASEGEQSGQSDFRWEARETTGGTVPASRAPVPATRIGRAEAVTVQQPLQDAGEPEREAAAERPEPAAAPKTEARPPDPTRVAAPAPDAEAPKPADATRQETSPERQWLEKPFVQAGIFGVRSNAEKLIAKLKQRNVPAVGKVFRSGEREFTRVLVGPFETIDQRSAAQRLIRDMGMRDALAVAR